MRRMLAPEFYRIIVYANSNKIQLSRYSYYKVIKTLRYTMNGIATMATHTQFCGAASIAFIISNQIYLDQY